jgi:hypothetical protein
VRLRAGETLQIRVTFKCQRGHFPGEDDEHLFARARKLADAAVSKGFAEVGAAAAAVTDPSDAERTLDTFFEVTVAKDAPSFDDAVRDLQAALSFERNAEGQAAHH